MKTLNFILDDFLGWVVGEPPAFGEDSYDTVVMSEVLEHLDEKQRKKALDVAWKISRHRVIVTLPLKDVNEPSHLKAFWTAKEAEELFKDYVKKVTIGFADPSRWIIVAEKREVPK
jgi:2-polyprenyl-3-methyl-5-hydroxy-6-metoxy-1,4-benzoquinol methylase